MKLRVQVGQMFEVDDVAAAWKDGRMIPCRGQNLDGDRFPDLDLVIRAATGMPEDEPVMLPDAEENVVIATQAIELEASSAETCYVAPAREVSS